MMNGISGSGGGAGQLLQMSQLNQQLNEQAARRSMQTTERAKQTASAVIDLNIANQQRAVIVGKNNLNAGKIINTTA